MTCQPSQLGVCRLIFTGCLIVGMLSSTCRSVTRPTARSTNQVLPVKNKHPSSQHPMSTMSRSSFESSPCVKFVSLAFLAPSVCRVACPCGALWLRLFCDLRRLAARDLGHSPGYSWGTVELDNTNNMRRVENETLGYGWGTGGVRLTK